MLYQIDEIKVGIHIQIQWMSQVEKTFRWKSSQLEDFDFDFDFKLEPNFYNFINFGFNCTCERNGLTNIILYIFFEVVIEFNF